MIIDVHVHYRGDAQLAQALRQTERLDMVLCLNSINLEGTASPHFPSAAFVAACNDRTLAAARENPQRVIPFWYLNPAHGDAACAELRRRVAQHQRPQGVKLWMALKGNDPRVDPVLDLCAEYRLPVLQHTNIEAGGTLPTETTPQEMREMAQRHPDVTFLWGHAGSDYEFGVKCALGLDNVLMDIAGNEATNGYTEMLVRHLGAERVVYGSDATGRSFASQLAKVYGADITESEREDILHHNARALLARQRYD
ncbi:MAG: amidohydrolase family protein [Chloroflexi bacterium]|nr:amidohydrolase family protein [Chloroflexota bacterium]